MLRITVLSVVLVCSTFLTDFSVASGKIYLIAGNPAPQLLTRSSPVLLYSLEDSGVRKLRTIATQKQNAFFIRPYQEKGFVLVGSEATPTSFQIDKIDLSSIEKEQSFEFSICKDCYFFRSHMVELGDENVLMHVSGNSINDVLRVDIAGLNINNGSVVKMGYANLKSVYSFGTSSGNEASGDRLASIYADGRNAAWGYYQKLDLGWELPEGFNPAETERIFQLVNNDSIRIMTSSGLVDRKHDNYTYYINDKKNNKWSSVILDGNFLSVRGFKHWLVSQEAYISSTENSFTDSNGLFLTASERFAYSGISPTGRLYLYDGIASRLIVHETNEPDSEVLFVDFDEVYFRVADEIRLGHLRLDHIDNIRTLVKSPLILAVHWLVKGKSYESKPEQCNELDATEDDLLSVPKVESND